MSLNYGGWIVGAFGLANCGETYRIIQEEGSVFWEVISTIVRKKFV